MKLSEAWVRLAEDFAKYPTQFGGGWLCNHLDARVETLGIPVDVHTLMDERIHADIEACAPYPSGTLQQTYDLYWSPGNRCAEIRENNAARVLVCLMFAWEARDAEERKAKRKARAFEQRHTDACGEPH